MFNDLGGFGLKCISNYFGIYCIYFHFIFVRSSSHSFCLKNGVFIQTRGKNGNLPSYSSFVELRTPSQPNTSIRQLQLYPELAPPGVLEWSSSTQSWSHAKQGHSRLTRNKLPDLMELPCCFLMKLLPCCWTRGEQHPVHFLGHWWFPPAAAPNNDAICRSRSRDLSSACSRARDTWPQFLM